MFERLSRSPTSAAAQCEPVFLAMVRDYYPLVDCASLIDVPAHEAEALEALAAIENMFDEDGTYIRAGEAFRGRPSISNFFRVIRRGFVGVHTNLKCFPVGDREIVITGDFLRTEREPIHFCDHWIGNSSSANASVRFRETLLPMQPGSLPDRSAIDGGSRTTECGDASVKIGFVQRSGDVAIPFIDIYIGGILTRYLPFGYEKLTPRSPG